MENLLNEKESLELIGQMISTAKNNLQKGTGKIFLLWGYLVAGISFGTVVLSMILPKETAYHAYLLWFLMFLGMPVHFWLLKKREHERLVMTYIEKLMRWVWIGFTISILVVVVGMLLDTVILSYFVSDAKGDNFVYWFQWLLLTPIMLCLYGFALFVSGKAYGFKPLVIGGIVCFIGSFLLLFSIHKTGVVYFQQLVLCVSAVAGFVIPGHMLNRKERKDV
ncbi:MAG: hypothetical protein NTU51_07940 [Bacteroidetes bacterium]|nr:hypothetical protein [Bacteroidota bacterium]